MLLLAGPGIKNDATIPGATLLDITPTVLALFGLPVGRDMEGKVLVNAFEDTPLFERIDSVLSEYEKQIRQALTPQRRTRRTR